jgi:maltooligosyltrehalose trehalohydrolase
MLLLLSPATPLLFQGQEFGSRRPFRYFADHVPSLAEQIRCGRRRFLSQFARYTEPEVARCVTPESRATFEASVLDDVDSAPGEHWFALHRDLIARRRADPVLSACDVARPEGAVLTEQALLLRWIRADGDRLLLINAGHDVDIASLAEPLLAPPEGRRWQLALSTEAMSYGGSGIPALTDERWLLTGQSGALMTAVAVDEARS